MARHATATKMIGPSPPPPKERRRYCMAQGKGGGWMYENRHHVLVPLSTVPDHGILNIIRHFEDATEEIPDQAQVSYDDVRYYRSLYAWLKIVRSEATRRGIDPDKVG